MMISGLLLEATTSGLLTWLVEQAPVVVVLGVVIYWLQKKLNKAEIDKDSLAKDVIKLTTLWEEKSDKMENRNEKTNNQILDLLRDIKAILKNT
tara:strand:+ start:15383 stop:15664 length:282 start_codon:yes stop_codon:yes gene_type:complete